MSGSVRIIDMPDLGAVNDGSSVVGDRAGSGRFIATAVRDYVSSYALGQVPGLQYPITQTATGHFYQDQGARIHRFYDRLFITGAAVNDGHATNVVKDWLTQQTGLGWPVFTSQVAVLSDTGQIGVLGGSRTSDVTPPEVVSSGTAIGVGAWVINDYASPTVSKHAWATYIEARTGQVNQGVTWGMELDIAAFGGHLAPSTPYTYYVPYGAYGITVASGAGQTGVNDATVALAVQNNNAKFLTGLKFDANAITGADGTAATGQGEAVALACGHRVQWYRSDNTKGPYVASLQSAAGGENGLLFNNTALLYVSGATTVFGISTVAPATGYTNLSIMINNTGAVLQNVFLGNVDTGGAGKRALCVPN